MFTAPEVEQVETAVPAIEVGEAVITCVKTALVLVAKLADVLKTTVIEWLPLVSKEVDAVACPLVFNAILLAIAVAPS